MCAPALARTRATSSITAVPERCRRHWKQESCLAAEVISMRPDYDWLLR